VENELGGSPSVSRRELNSSQREAKLTSRFAPNTPTRRTRENVKPPVPSFGSKRQPVKRDAGQRSSTSEHKSEDASLGVEEEDYEHLQ